jgi:hypothetical protein
LRCEGTVSDIEERLAAGANRFGFHLIHYSIQTNHIHWIVEADDEKALTRGMQGLLVRVAKGLNKSWGRKGRVFVDRYHARALKTPREVRNALVYVLANVKKHGGSAIRIDPYSSATAFKGWKDATAAELARLRSRGPPGLDPKTWLLVKGWKKHGLVSIHERPAA